MARRSNLGSLTKEPPLERLDETIKAIRPGMAYAELLDYAARRTHPDAPGLVAKRFLLLDANDRIVYDRFLSIVNAEGIGSARVRKVMYLVWALRDERLRRFICEKVAGRDGKWRINALKNKANASFLEEWLNEASAKKARSNIEFFFVETGIYDPSGTGAIHLELQDGWLQEAMQVAAQHEGDAATRSAMIAAPAEFLVARGWNGLVNATPEELGGMAQGPPPETDPLEDTSIPMPPPRTDRGRPWEPTDPRTVRRRGRGVVEVNLVALERASQAHQLLERLLAEAAIARNYEPRNNENIDLFFETQSGWVLAEIKSCQRNNIHSQIRRGVSQLLEYQYVYRELLGRNVSLVLVVETEPVGNKAWLGEFLNSLGITLVWKNAQDMRLIAGATIPDSLNGLVARP